MKRQRPPRADLSTWRENADGSRSRVYGSYEAYVAHQSAKLATMTPDSLREHEERFYLALNRRLKLLVFDWSGKTVLCLGARTGVEVQAFQSHGAFAVGIDLNPGPGNRYVLTGDFHGTVFPAGSVDVVYTNALDHALELSRVIAEAHRLLRPRASLDPYAATGLLIVEATTKQLGEYESFAWKSIDGLVASIVSEGFKLMHRENIDEPWRGEQLVLGRA